MVKILGGDVEGVLSEYVVLAENLLVRLLDYLIWNEMRNKSRSIITWKLGYV